MYPQPQRRDSRASHGCACAHASRLSNEYEGGFEFEVGGGNAVNTVLPRSGAGFYSYHPGSPGRQYGTAATIGALQAVGAAWAAAHPNGPRIGIGDVSFKGGGKMPPHVSHDKGVDVDLRIMRNDGKELGTTYRDRSYSHALTQQLVDLIRGNTVASVKVIYFNDPAVKGVRPWKGHDNHLHVRFMPGTGTTANGSPPPRPAPPPSPAPKIDERALLQARIAAGTRDENTLTDAVFFARHPERGGRPLARGEKTLAAEWLQIRNQIVRPLLAKQAPSPRPPAPSPPRAPQTPAPSPPKPTTAPVPTSTDPDVLAAAKRWNLPTGVAATPMFHQLVDRWRPAHFPLPLLVAFSSLEAYGWKDATHGTAANGWTKPAFYELGVFQVPAGLHGRCTSKRHEDCQHAPPGTDAEGKSAWFRICKRLGLDARDWTNPTTQVRVGIANLEADAATVRRLFPALFPNPGSDWALRASVLMPFGPGIGYTIKLLRKHKAQLERLPEAGRWSFLRLQGARTQNVDKKMLRALKFARARGLPTTGLDGV
jgi:hypothetical protein